MMKPADLATLLLMGALWGGSYLFIRVGVPELGSLPLMGGRVALAALILWGGLRAAGRRPEIRPHFRPLLVIGLSNAALPFSLIAWAELRLGASLTAVLGATVPLFGAVLSALWLGERLTIIRASGLAFGLLGVVVLTGWSPIAIDAPTLAAIGATLVASLSYAGSGVYVRRRLAGIPAGTLALGQQLGAVVWLAVPALLFLPDRPPSPAALGAMGALAALSTALAFVLFFRMIERVGPTQTQSVTYVTPAFGMLWGWLFLDEPITSGMLGGFGLVLVGMLLVKGSVPRLTRPRATRLGSRRRVAAGSA